MVEAFVEVETSGRIYNSPLDSIFGTVKANFMELNTRVLFPETNDEIKQRVIAEYGQVTQRKPQTGEL